MGENKVQIVVTTDASGSVTAIRQIGDEATASAEKTKKASVVANGAWSSTKDSILSVTNAIRGFMAYEITRKTIEWGEHGAKVLQVEGAYESLTRSIHANGDALLAGLKAATAGTIDEASLMQKAIKGIAQELSPEQMTRIGEMARMAAIKQGISVEEAYERITDSMANNMPRALKQMGLISKEQERLVNEAIAQGITDINLFAMASLHAATQEAKIGTEALTAMEKLQKLHAEMKENKETIEKSLVPAYGFLLEQLARTSKGATDVAEALHLIKKEAPAPMMDYADWKKKAGTLGGLPQVPLVRDPAQVEADKKKAEDAEKKKQHDLAMEVQAKAIGEARASRIEAEMQIEEIALNKFKNLQDLKLAILQSNNQRAIISDDEFRQQRREMAKEDFDEAKARIANELQEQDARYAAKKMTAKGKPEERAVKLEALASEDAVARAKLYERADAAANDYQKKLIELDLEEYGQLKKSREGLLAYVNSAIEARDKAVKKEAEAEEWLKERIGEYTISETDFKEQKLIEEFMKRAEILGWTEQMYKTFKAGLSQIDDDARQKSFTDEINYQRSLIDVYQKMHTLDPTEAARQRVELTQRQIAAEESLLETAIPGSENYRSIIKTINELRLQLINEDIALKEREGTMWEGMIEGAKRYSDSQPTEYQKGLELFNTMQSSMENRTSEFFDYQNKGWRNWRKEAGDLIHDVYMELMKLYVIKPLIGSAGSGGGDGSGLIGLLSRLFGGDGSTSSNFSLGQAEDISNLPEELSAGASFHMGGNVMAYIPRRHSGGLRENERLTINKVNERYITEEQNEWLTAIAKKMDSKDQSQQAAPTIVTHITIQATDADSFRGQLWRVKEDVAAMMGSLVKDNHPIRRAR